MLHFWWFCSLIGILKSMLSITTFFTFFFQEFWLTHVSCFSGCCCDGVRDISADLSWRFLLLYEHPPEDHILSMRNRTIANGGFCYCSMANVKGLKLCLKSYHFEVSFQFKRYHHNHNLFFYRLKLVSFSQL